MASEIRVNKIENRSGLGTVTFADTGVDLAGIVTATTFSGSGASLTGLPAAQLSGTLPAISGANLTNLAAANLTGTIADARFPATLPAASAANLTSIPAANVTGTLPALTAANLTNIPAANIVGVATAGFERSGGFPNTWVKLQTTTISSDVSDVTFTNSITDAFDTYKMYAIVFTQLQPTNDGVELRMRIQEGGSTDTSNNYRARVFSSDGNISNNLNRDHLRLNKDALGNATSGSAVLEDTNGIIYMTNFVANREWRYYGFHMFGNNSQDRNFDNFGGGFAGTNATTGIVIFPESGSWASGTLTLYGIAQ